MKLFLKRLSEGIRLSDYVRLRMPRASQERVASATEDMQRAALLLHEASSIIKALATDEGTFGQRERAAQWIRTYQQP